MTHVQAPNQPARRPMRPFNLVHRSSNRHLTHRRPCFRFSLPRPLCPTNAEETYFVRAACRGTCLTLATCSAFWCSTPPWRRKPHGAPPDNVTTASSATIVLLSFFSFFLVIFRPLSVSFFPNISSGGPPQYVGPIVRWQGPLSEL